MNIDSKILKAAYGRQKYDAVVCRGISFELTYKQWLQIWIDSGHLHERGPRRGQYVMARYGDRGPYAVGNVKIITGGENLSEGHLGKTISARQKIKMSKALQGRTTWIKGRKHSEETKKKISKASTGRILSSEARKKISNFHKGVKKTESHRFALSNSIKGFRWITNGLVNRKLKSGDALSEGREFGRKNFGGQSVWNK